jgi:hypothetical protein
MQRLRFEVLSAIGRMLAQVELNRVECRTSACGSYYSKKRLWYAALLIPAGNLYLRMQGACVRVCFDAEWRDWDSKMYEASSGRRVKREEGGGLLFPAIPGEALASILASPAFDPSQKMKAFEAAVQALERFHHLLVEWPDGKRRMFSHADATVRNVICDPAAGTACWFDFETIHDPAMGAQWRHADDLRALLYSAAEYLEADALDTLCRVGIQGYGDTATLRRLGELIVEWRRRPRTYHLAQGRLGIEKRERMDALLLRELAMMGVAPCRCANQFRRGFPSARFDWRRAFCTGIAVLRRLRS